MTLPRKQLVSVEDTSYSLLFSVVYVVVTCVLLMLVLVKTLTFFCSSTTAPALY